MDPKIINQKFQCKDCIYTYNPLVGDSSQGIAPGTAFKDLPNNWVCPLCKATKVRFRSRH